MVSVTTLLLGWHLGRPVRFPWGWPMVPPLATPPGNAPGSAEVLYIKISHCLDTIKPWLWLFVPASLPVRKLSHKLIK